MYLRLRTLLTHCLRNGVKHFLMQNVSHTVTAAICNMLAQRWAFLMFGQNNLSYLFLSEQRVGD